MAESSAFTYVTEALEQHTSLTRLEARGTVRLALKNAGLSADSVTAEQMAVVLERVLPGELETRGITDAACPCADIASGLSTLDAESDLPETPDAVFARLGGR